MLKLKAIFAFILLIPFLLPAQPEWKRSAPPEEGPLDLFHATIIANLPTATTIAKGDFQFMIGHRFLPSIKDGYDSFYGIDGPAKIRLELGYGISNRLSVTLGRTNLMDNLDLQVKFKTLEIRNNILPGIITLKGGIAVNTEIPEGLGRDKFDSDNFQYYGQFIYNTMFFKKKLGVGIVPSYLYNSDIFNSEKRYTFSLGNYYQYYFDAKWSIWLELNPIVTGYQGPIEFGVTEKSYNSVTFGFDVETGGHFFKIFLTNNARINLSQYIVGADKSASSGEWRIGFNIIRVL
jgi:hypothetical protein